MRAVMERNKAVEAFVVIAVLTIVALVLPRAVREWRAQEERGVATPTSVPMTRPERGQVLAYQQELVATTLPPRDTPGGRDLSGVARYPGAVIIKNDESKDGLIRSVKYLTTDDPIDVGAFYMTEFLPSSWREMGMGMLSHTGHGWWGSYMSHDGLTAVAIFGMSKWMDEPAGGESNPTTISVVVIACRPHPTSWKVSRSAIISAGPQAFPP